MPNADSIRIRIPGHGNKSSPLQREYFWVVGVAKGDSIQGVAGTITLLTAPYTAYAGTQVFFNKPNPPFQLPCGHTFLWALSFGSVGAGLKIPAGSYSLKVSGVDATGTTINGITRTVDEFIVGRAPTVKFRGPPDIMYPAPNQDITAEAQGFTAYGSNNITVTAQIGAQSATVTWDPGSGTWFASFPPLTGTGELVLSVSDNAPSTSSEYVYVSTGGGGGGGVGGQPPP